MTTIQQILKNTAVNGVISLERAAKIAEPLDQERAATIELLRRLDRQVGMTVGEIINKHIAAMQGTKFNEVDYHYEAMPSDQRI